MEPVLSKRLDNANDATPRSGVAVETLFAVALLALLLTLSIVSHAVASRAYANPAYDTVEER